MGGDLPAFEEILARTLDDGRLSRSEGQALRAHAAEQSPHTLAAWRHQAFDAARAQAASGDANTADILEWLEDVVRALVPAPEEAPAAGAAFSPGEDCRDRIAGLLRSCRGRVDICVFTITDDLLSREIAAAHARGVAVRIITDDDKSEDRGSDAEALRRRGVPVRFDRTDAHMHHKFAIFDGAVLLNGSYNWTRSAFTENEENILVTGDQRLVGAFAAEFESLWARLG